MSYDGRPFKLENSNMAESKHFLPIFDALINEII